MHIIVKMPAKGVNAKRCTARSVAVQCQITHNKQSATLEHLSLIIGSNIQFPLI